MAETQEKQRVAEIGSYCWYCGKETTRKTGKCFFTHSRDDLKNAKFPEFSPYKLSPFDLCYPGKCGLVKIPDDMRDWPKETQLKWRKEQDEIQEMLINERLLTK